MDFAENSSLQDSEIQLREAPIFNSSHFETTWFGYRGPNSFSARGSLNAFQKDFKIEAKPKFEDFLKKKTSMEQEISDLTKRNGTLEEEKEKLISELINIRIKEIQKNGINFIQDVPENFDDDYSKNFAEVFRAFQNQITEYEKKVEKFEEENEKCMERMFELEMEKQRLKIKLHQSIQQCSSLKDTNHQLKTDLETVHKEKSVLEEKLKELEKVIEKIEDGDFEHVEKTDDLMNGVIELDTPEAEKSADMEIPEGENH